MSDAVACAVCGAPCGEPLYHYDGPLAVSSTARTLPVPTIVHACPRCAHLQTRPLEDIERYYDTGYNVHLESDDADDLYELTPAGPVFRTQHQAIVALAKLDLAPGTKILDYGCGKGSTLRMMLAERPGLDAAVFDVSDNYRAAWDAFLPAARQATYETPVAWREHFDVVMTFFALEHVAHPREFLSAVRDLLRPGGTLHLIVPNIRRNVGDLIVVDHCNHFMPSSLRHAFTAAGFDEIRIDEEAHAAAYVIDARRATAPPATVALDPGAAGYLAEARGYAAFWTGAGAAVRRFEADVAAGRPAAIYGSGLYGVFIGTQLRDAGHVAAYLDQNPHQQAKRVLGKPVVAPAAVGDEIAVVYVALNPARAREIIAGVPALNARPRDFFYLG